MKFTNFFLIFFLSMSCTSLFAADDGAHQCCQGDVVLMNELRRAIDLTQALNTKWHYVAHAEDAYRADVDGIHEGFGAFVKIMDKILCQVDDQGLKNELAGLRLGKFWENQDIYAKHRAGHASLPQNYWKDIRVNYVKLWKAKGDEVKKIIEAWRDRCFPGTTDTDELGEELSRRLREQLKPQERASRNYFDRLTGEEMRRITLRAALDPNKAKPKEVSRDQGALIEEAFLSPRRAQLAIVGLHPDVPGFETIKAFLHKVVKDAEQELESSPAGISTKKERDSVRHVISFIIKASPFKPLEGMAGLQIDIVITCFFLNIIQWTDSALPISHQKNINPGESRPFEEAVRQLIMRDMPLVKKGIYERALAPENVQLLYTTSRQVLAANPVRSLRERGGVHLPWPFVSDDVESKTAAPDDGPPSGDHDALLLNGLIDRLGIIIDAKSTQHLHQIVLQRYIMETCSQFEALKKFQQDFFFTLDGIQDKKTRSELRKIEILLEDILKQQEPTSVNWLESEDNSRAIHNAHRDRLMNIRDRINSILCKEQNGDEAEADQADQALRAQRRLLVEYMRLNAQLQVQVEPKGGEEAPKSAISVEEQELVRYREALQSSFAKLFPSCFRLRRTLDGLNTDTWGGHIRGSVIRLNLDLERRYRQSKNSKQNGFENAQSYLNIRFDNIQKGSTKWGRHPKFKATAHITAEVPGRGGMIHALASKPLRFKFVDKGLGFEPEEHSEFVDALQQYVFVEIPNLKKKVGICEHDVQKDLCLFCQYK